MNYRLTSPFLGRILEKSFFLLPFCLLGGAFLQGLGFYTLAMLLPFFYYFDPSITSQKKLVQIAIIGLCIFFLFPFMSYLSLLFDSKPLQENMLTFFSILKSFFKTPVSSVIGGSGLLFLCLVFLSKHFFKDNAEIKLLAHPFSSFHWGMLYASLFLLLYVWLQHEFGFDYRQPSFLLSTDKQLLTGAYRSLGFYGHPLSLASVSLALFAYYSVFFKEEVSSTQKKVYLTIACFHFLILAITGSRTPFFIAILFLLGSSFWMLKKNSHQSFLKKVLLFGIMLMALISTVLYFGLHNRYMELWQSIQSGGINREAFWSVHWQMFLDKPFFGQGSLWLSQGIRESYYAALGYGNLTEKYNAHNIYLEVLASCGIIGASVLGFCFSKLIRILKQGIQSQTGGVMFKALMISISLNAIHGLTQNTFFDTNLIYVYWTLIWIFLWQNL